MDFYSYLLKRYGYDEPIFSSDLSKELRMNKNTLRQYLKRLTDNNKIERYEYKQGIYFIPSKNSMNSIFNKPVISVNKIIKKKYVFKGEKRIGFETGLSFANDIRLTTQVPSTVEIVTEVESQPKRTVVFNKREVALRKAKTEINDYNYKILQILELLVDFDRVSDLSLEEAKPKIADYVMDVQIEATELAQYVQLYKQTDKFYGSGLYNEITRRQGTFC
ncbi:hypothetical protein [Bacillus sp. Brlt_9]|uniref:hypothetical protein n=1 Tax=Bacillus sp. Brlt_9 TaxID=3110916 RepID=UPI003F7BCBF7